MIRKFEIKKCKIKIESFSLSLNSLYIKHKYLDEKSLFARLDETKINCSSGADRFRQIPIRGISSVETMACVQNDERVRLTGFFLQRVIHDEP